ncbi:MAG: hypothetical protein JWM10_4648 [Myxococcaceae bacterium]|nr:hypothetical protein [Myxococcaceae bacterium]
MACALWFAAIVAFAALVIWFALGRVPAVRERQGSMLLAALDAPVALRTYALAIVAEGRRDGVPLRAMLLLNPLVWAGTPVAPKTHVQLATSLLGASLAFGLRARGLKVGAVRRDVRSFDAAFTLTGDDTATAALSEAHRAEALALVSAWSQDDDNAWELRTERGELVFSAPAPVPDALVARAATLLVGLRAAMLEALERRARGGVADAGYRGGVRVDLAEGEPVAAPSEGSETTRGRSGSAKR